MNLRNKRILITAGPTWVPIDSVRVISNIATGETGHLLARRLARAGAKVTLFLGPVESLASLQGIKLIRFRFFDELKNKLIKELRLNKYELIIHNAAVADFAPAPYKGKLASGKPLSLKLRPLPKITADIRRFAPQAKLVIFKLEAGVSDRLLIKRAVAACNVIGADLVVANRIAPYRAFIIGKKRGDFVCAESRADLVKRLIKFFNL